MGDLYRWECENCDKHGRWLKDPGLASCYGEQHMERTSSRYSQSYNGHMTYVADKPGRNLAPCA